MITQLRIQNFKSWRDTGQMRFAPLTAFFGPNSSGKTSILQFLLMLKQTVESSDRSQVLFLGDQHSYVNFTTFSEVLFRHQPEKSIVFDMQWDALTERIEPNKPEVSVISIAFHAEVGQEEKFITLKKFNYVTTNGVIGIKQNLKAVSRYYEFSEDTSIAYTLPFPSLSGNKPFKVYRFPLELVAQQSSDVDNRLSQLESYFEGLFRSISYLGPLREYPKSDYYWSGSAVSDVGMKGENVIQALLSQRERTSLNERPSGVELTLAYWLKNLGLIHSFKLSTSGARQRYEVRIQQTANSPEVSLTDVGFGVSQVLPVIAQCYFAPQGSTIILEQPELHLHPAVQAGLADVLVDAIKTRGIQIILESHSEHLLRRLQRRLAEEQLIPEDIALYFTHIEEGESKLDELNIDAYGSISNWPSNFFGDEMGDMVAATRAAMNRQMAKGLQVNGTHKESIRQ